MIPRPSWTPPGTSVTGRRPDVRFPEPPAGACLDPAVQTWEVGRALVRAYDVEHGPLAFNASEVPGRFRPLHTVAGDVVGTAYAAEDDETAVAERLLRGVDTRADGAPRRLLLRHVRGVALAFLMPQRELRLARLHGLGLQRLRLSRAALIDSGAHRYAWTARWAQALHAASASLDGLVWSSRQNDGRVALMLFGDRVADGDLVVEAAPLRLDSGLGLQRLVEIANVAGVELPGLAGE
jgi:hypothetical protein